MKELSNISKIDSLLFDQKKLFAELNGKTKEINEIPDAYQSRVFWSDIQSESKKHNRNVEWLKKLKKENNHQKHGCLTVTKEMVSMKNREILHLKAPGRDGVQGFWIKK